MLVSDAKKCKEHPKLGANCFSRCFYWWVKDIFWNGKKNDFQAKDLYDLLPEDLSETVSKHLEISWQKEKEEAQKSDRKPSLKKALITTYRRTFIKIVLPIPLQNVTSYFHPASKMTPLEAYLNAGLLIFLMIFQLILMRHTYNEMRRLGTRMKIACTSLMYKKVLRLSYLTASRNSGGSIINLMTNDVSKFDTFMIFLPFLVIAPVQVTIETCLIWSYVGYAGLVGIAFMIIQIIPAQVLFYRIIRKLRSKLFVKIDERIFLINEIIHGIRTIKMFVWEKAFEKLVYSARSREIQYFLRVAYMDGLNNALIVFAYRLSIYLSILVYALQNGSLLASTVMLLTHRMLNLRLSLGVHLMTAVKFLAEGKVSLKRIETFLLLPEIESSVQNIENENKNISISIKKASASWNETLIEKSLDNISVDVTLNKLYAVIGEVGSGKSTLLKLILGELRPVTGEVFVRGNISYASQDPWIFPGSVRDNIIFGEKFDEDRYNEVTEVCILTKDFCQLPYGDRTLVGEKGINLSGGQCARINMARAVYRDASIYLFDDPLSSLDTHVSKKLFKDCINGFLKNKTRLLVTHNCQILKNFDKVILLEKGKVEFQGTFSELQKNNQYLNYLPSNDDDEKADENKKDVENSDKLVITSNSFVKEEKKTNEPNETEELIAKGFVAKSLYWKYLRAGGSYLTLFVLLLNLFLAVFSMAGFDYWLLAWTKQEELNFKNSTQSTQVEDSYVIDSLTICGALLATVILTNIFKNIIFYRIFLNAGKHIHNKMFASLMKAPLRFFDVNHSGRILNRFSNDTGDVDDILPRAIFKSINDTLMIVATILPIIMVKWWYIFPLLFVSFLIFQFSKIFVATTQNIKRVESNARSPFLSLAVSSLSGLATIRSCGAESRVSRAFNSFQNKHSSALIMSIFIATFFSVFAELAMYVLTAFTVFGCILYADSGLLSSEVALILLQLLNFSKYMHYTIKLIAETTSQMTSIERMYQFTKLEQEEEEEEGNLLEPPKAWPRLGAIKFKHMYLRYSEDGEPVLKNLNFLVGSGMKVGIVGRTGAGKSSLISALLRLAKIEGSILIDGVDIQKVSLETLRSKISVIPQEPILFSTSLRNNLDPYKESDDATIWSALRDVELNGLFDALDFPIDRGGSNLSSGQRQLLCLARAIVKKNKILILDEATASVDPATDALIQKAVRLKFQDYTVLTIAHRLSTVVDSDMILVLDGGEVVEYDDPKTLLKKGDGFFAEMMAQAKEYKPNLEISLHTK